MKKGDIVFIGNSTKKPPRRLYSWNDMGLTSEYITLPAGTVLYHASLSHKITSFAPCLTCFTKESPLAWDYIYRFELLSDVVAEKVDRDEYRIDLNKVPNDAVKIVYLGTAQIVKNVALVNKFGIVQARPYRFSFAKEYKDEERRFNLEQINTFNKKKDWMKKILLTFPGNNVEIERWEG